MATAAAKAAPRQSVSLPAATLKQVKALARERRTTTSRTLAQLVEEGLEAQQARRAQFVDLAERYRAEADPAKAEKLGDQLGRMVFGG